MEYVEKIVKRSNTLHVVLINLLDVLMEDVFLLKFFVHLINVIMDNHLSVQMEHVKVLSFYVSILKILELLKTLTIMLKNLVYNIYMIREVII